MELEDFYKNKITVLYTLMEPDNSGVKIKIHTVQFLLLIKTGEIMKGLLKKLPPFAPDYSGVNSVFYELGGITIINGADGCIGNVTGYDEPRYFEKKGHIFSTGLRNIQAIAGDENILLKKIKDLPFLTQVSCLVLMGTPTSAVIASDHKGVAKLLEEELNIPVISINTTGIDGYEMGAQKAFLALAKRFVKPSSQLGSGVNIIGATPLDYWGRRQIDSIVNGLTAHGVNVRSCWTMEGGMKAIENTLNGEINLVVSVSGIPAAKHLEKVYGMPYIIGVPVGEEDTENFANILNRKDKNVCSEKKLFKEERSERRKLEKLFIEKKDIAAPVVIAGEQIWANGFRRFLSCYIDFSQISVVSFFQMNHQEMAPQDVYVNSEDIFLKTMKKKNPATIIGDPLYRRLIFSSSNSTYVDVPHLAVSSRLYWNHNKIYVGEKIIL